MKRKLLRIAAAIVGVLVLVLLILWIIGGRTSVTEANINIAASPEKVFPYLTEPEKAKQWMEGVAEITPLDGGDHRVGAKARIVIEENGTRFEMEDEVIRSEENRLVEFRITSSMFDLTSLYELTDEGGTANLKHTMRADYKGWVRVFVPLMGGEVKRKLDADFQRLKQIVEAK